MIRINNNFSFSVLVLLFAFFLLSTVFSYSDNALSSRKLTTAQVFDSLSVNAFNLLLKQVPVDSNSQLNFKISEHPSAIRFQNVFLSEFQSMGITIGKENSFKAGLSMFIKEFYIEYLYNESQDSLKRRAVLVIGGNFTSADKLEKSFNDIQSIFEDTIATNELNNIVSNEFKYAEKPLPERKNSFFEEVFEPALVVVTAIITTVLLFTIRSN
jgi:hypothetical protein